MKKSYRLFGLLALILCVSILGFGSYNADAASKDFLIIGTGDISGSYYPMGGAMASIWTKNLDAVSVTAQSTGASLENTKLIENGEIELGLTQNDMAEYAVKGQLMFDRKYTKFRAVASIFPEHVQIVVRTGSGVKSISDLKGRKISVGAQGSGEMANCEQILGVFGITMGDITPYYLSYGDAVDRMKDDLLDAVFVTSGAPNAAMQDLAMSKDVTFLNISDDELENIVAKYPFFQEAIIPAGMYKGQDQEYRTIAVQAVLIAREDLSDELIYDLTKTLWTYREDLGEIMAKAKSMDPNNPLKGITVDVHPGAMKYYKETKMVK